MVKNRNLIDAIKKYNFVGSLYIRLPGTDDGSEFDYEISIVLI